MATGRGSDSGASFEAVLDRKLLNVTNTMDSIQGLSTWCIDYKKYHSMIVRQWIKCLKKSDTSHKLNLFYLANDVIQNCKRKNALVYRTAFADVLPEAFLLIKHEGDAKVVKSVERILSIWQERSVYSDALITELRSSLVKEESPPVTPVEQKNPVESKAELRSKIVAEFVPQALVEQLSQYKRSLEEVDLREKQVAAMRVDICSSDALKKLKDKAGGKKFSRDFEEGSTQLQEFVKFFDRQNKTGAPLLEALSNADIFYEMQYKEVKIVANAYQTFANRVSHLKRKLDNLKATLPDLDESPIPSPSADAPSPTGSESPFHDLELTNPNPDVDGFVMDEEAEPPAPSPLSSIGESPKRESNLGENDNREVEDMELSDEEMVSGGIIVEEHIKGPRTSDPIQPPNVVTKNTEPFVATAQPAAHGAASVSSPTESVESVNLGKIGSILNSLSSAMKNAGPSVESPSATSSYSSVGTMPAATQDASSLVDILAKVDVSPADILSALSKVQAQGGLEGITSLLSSPATNVPAESSKTGKAPPASSFPSASAAPAQSPLTASSATLVPSSSSNATVKQSTGPLVLAENKPTSAPVRGVHRNVGLTAEVEATKPDSLESKIHNFLHGNPAFNSFDLSFTMNPPHRVDNLSPGTGTDTQDGTPVRDEGGGTPTQDEAMDMPAGPESGAPTPRAVQKNLPQNPETTKLHLQPGVAQNGQLYQPYTYGDHCMTEPVAQYQPIPNQGGGPGAPGSTVSAQTMEGFEGMGDRGWYGKTYSEGGFQQPTGYNVTIPAKNQPSGEFEFQAEQTQEPQGFGAQQSVFFGSLLPPVPKLPPPPVVFDTPPPGTSHATTLSEKQAAPQTDFGESCQNRGVPGMVVQDHLPKSICHPDDQHPPPDNMHYPEDNEHYHEDVLPHPGPHFQNSPYSHPDVPFYPQGSPRHPLPRIRGRLTPPHSPSQDAFYNQDYQRQSPPRPHNVPRRPPRPPHFEMRPPGLRPPHRPSHPAHNPFPRGPPRVPFLRFHGAEPRLRGKRLGPRGGLNPGPMFAPKRPFPPPRY
ncbi:regulation of nuclear pre-mRNA domain-containing protein 2a [Dunckerocampus dactyliophorus]|uniref:regulation of nuclear pre-mRNA domain-containing protein 2a n=1 Tax=Dunckerocampus dactyliophorus TaxID=161453 RepID=UPI0024068E6E|nr:regulation of nuclear pre-mRNA domain-containing protein 2a [Dunckerocampus dactyliophorus]